MFRCKNWTVKMAECQRIDDFKLWWWRRLLRVPGTAGRSVNLKGNQPWIDTGRTDAEAEAPVLGHQIRRADSLEKTLLLRTIEGKRRRGQQRMRWLDDITDLMVMSLSNSGSWWWRGRPGVLQFMGSQRVGHDRATELNWTELFP